MYRQKQDSDFVFEGRDKKNEEKLWKKKKIEEKKSLYSLVLNNVFGKFL